MRSRETKFSGGGALSGWAWGGTLVGEQSLQFGEGSWQFCGTTTSQEEFEPQEVDYR